MNYSGMSYIVPAIAGMVAFVAWAQLLWRMRNLNILLVFRLLVFWWACMMLFSPIMDLRREHNFASDWDAFLSVVRVTAFRLGAGGLAIWIYYLLPMAYPVRTALSPYEKTSALSATEGFMAASDSEIHRPLPTTEISRLANEKTKTKELARVVSTAADATDATKKAEEALQKAGEAVAQVDKAAKVAATGSSSPESS